MDELRSQIFSSPREQYQQEGQEMWNLENMAGLPGLCRATGET